MNWIAVLAARLRQAWLIRLLGRIRPRCLASNSRHYWSPLVQAVAGGCTDCVELVMQYCHSKRRSAAWFAADWAFYMHRWAVLEYLVDTYGPSVLQDYTETAWLHLIHLDACSSFFADSLVSQVPHPDSGLESARHLHELLCPK